jgi:hypothetical protein
VLVDGTPERYLLDLQKIDPDGATRSLRQLAQSNADGFPDLAGSPGPQGEWQGLYPIVASGQLGVPGSLPDVPMVVISGLRPDGPGAREAAIARMKREEHSLLFQATTRGMHLVTDRSGHDVMKREPELVVQAIAWVVREVRAER